MSGFLLDSCSAVEDTPLLVEEGGAAVIGGDLRRRRRRRADEFNIFQFNGQNSPIIHFGDCLSEH